MTPAGWFCAQQGAREHYSVPRALAAAGALRRLVTDAWVPPGSLVSRLPRAVGRRLAGRFHPELAAAPVTAFTGRFLRCDLVQKVRRRPDAAFHTARNDLFDRLATRAFGREPGPPGTMFAYGHAARRLFAEAKARGWRTLLGQFDPGPREGEIVEREHAARPEFASSWRRYPAEYVDLWRGELDADVIVANSGWSRECLIQAGVPAAKIAVVPLVYAAPAAAGAAKDYPSAFTSARPLRLLFLGQAILRKGIARIVDAARVMKGEPVEFRVAGPTDISNLAEMVRGLPITLFGPVPRGEVDRHYREADAFLLPTLSDGYALTQLEALAWRLPLVVSRYCGAVVEPEKTGILLNEPTGPEIAAAARSFLARPESLKAMSDRTTVADYGLPRLTAALLPLGAGADRPVTAGKVSGVTHPGTNA